MLQAQDTVIYGLLTQIREWLKDDLDLLDVQIVKDQVLVNCTNAYLAFRCWKMVADSIKDGTALGCDITVLLNGKKYDSSARLNIMTSTWVRENRALFESLQEVCTTSVHAESEGYVYLAVQPYLGLEAVLNKPVRDLLNQPVQVLSSEIAEARVDCIRRAIATGGSASTEYTHSWRGVDWKKRSTAIYLPGHGQVLVRTGPARGEEWQNGFWENWKESAVSG